MFYTKQKKKRFLKVRYIHFLLDLWLKSGRNICINNNNYKKYGDVSGLLVSVHCKFKTIVN